MLWNFILRRKARRSLADATGETDRAAHGDFYGRHHHLQPGVRIRLQAETLLLTEWKVMRKQRNCPTKSTRAPFPIPWQRGISAQSALPWGAAAWISHGGGGRCGVCVNLCLYGGEIPAAGFVACLGLAFQTCLQLLAISVPQYTLTLPVVSQVLSCPFGMAVDANVQLLMKGLARSQETGRL